MTDWKAQEKKPAKATKSTKPTTPLAIRLAVLFRRRESTSWSEKEIKAFRKLIKDGCFEDLTDLTLVEKYMAAERKKGEGGFHRRELLTFLNNFRGEIDRARAWEERNRPKKPRAPIQRTQRTDATGANIEASYDPADAAPLPVAPEVAKFLEELAARKTRKGTQNLVIEPK